MNPIKIFPAHAYIFIPFSGLVGHGTGVLGAGGGCTATAAGDVERRETAGAAGRLVGVAGAAPAASASAAPESAAGPGAVDADAAHAAAVAAPPPSARTVSAASAGRGLGRRRRRWQGAGTPEGALRAWRRLGRPRQQGLLQRRDRRLPTPRAHRGRRRNTHLRRVRSSEAFQRGEIVIRRLWK